ncbi:MAG: phosphate/phosphite/phosphonate ABC transporter substrate-binding protein [Myxococcales bacterium FL481]|nr:MAG: phosphate/phosphite/phosphonate ABC transporter substrate-binding protein [Myxococcales bacterium FL481]
MTTAHRFVLSLVCGALVLGVGSARASTEPTASTQFLVLRERGPGSAAQAQPHVDRLMQRIGELSGWSAQGKYLRRREDARPRLEAGRVKFALLNLAAFLDLRQNVALEVLGSVDVSAAGGRRYHLVSKTARGVDGCRGQTVASDHAGDRRFVDRVVAGQAFSLADFQLRPTKRPIQTLKRVLRDEATCALIDDAQLTAAAKLEGGAALRTAWSSDQLPPMVLVATPGATAAERKRLRAQLSRVCTGPGEQACEAAGIRALRSSDGAPYRRVIAAYGK